MAKTKVKVSVKPLADRVVVKPLEESEQMRGGLYIPDTAKEKPSQGEVVAVGPGKVSEDGTRLDMDVKVGDRLGRVSLAAESRYNPKRLAPSEFAKPGAALRVSFPEVLDGDLAQAVGPVGTQRHPRQILLTVGLEPSGVDFRLDPVEPLEGGDGSARRACATTHAPG